MSSRISRIMQCLVVLICMIIVYSFSIEEYEDNTDIIKITQLDNGIIQIDYMGDDFCVLYVKNESVINSTEYKYIIYNNKPYIINLTEGVGTYSIKAYSVMQTSNQEEVITEKSNVYSVSLNNFSKNIFLASTSLVNFNDAETQSSINNMFKDTDDIDEIFYYFTNVVYDSALAYDISRGHIKTHAVNFSDLIENNKGICIDIATSMAIVLRSKGYPTQLVYGYVNTDENIAYHSWIRVYIDNKWIDYDPVLYKQGSIRNKNMYKITEYH